MRTIEPGWFWKKLNNKASFDLLVDKIKRMHGSMLKYFKLTGKMKTNVYIVSETFFW